MRKKICWMVLIIIFMISALAIEVSAYSFTTSMTPSNNKVAASTEFVVTVRVSNLSVGSNGINSLIATIDYDSEVFEEINQSSIEGLNGWSAKYEAGTSKITMKKNSFVNADEEVFQITLKTKSDVQEGTRGNISLSDIVASNSEEDISATNISTTITVGASGSGGIHIVPKNETENTNTPAINQNLISNNSVENNAVSNIVNMVSNNVANNNATTPINQNTVSNNSGGDMPYTGEEDEAMIRIIFGITLVALVAYIKIERLNHLSK